MTAQLTRPGAPLFAAIPGVAAAIAALAGAGLTSVSLLVVALACALAGGLRTCLDRLPTAFVWVSAVWIVPAQVAGLLRVPLLLAGWPARLLVGAVALACAVWVVRRGRGADPAVGHSVPWWAWTPTVTLVAWSAANRLLPPSQALRAYFASGDSIVHTEYALRVLVEGGITYVDDHYPVGWHALLAVAFGVHEASAVLSPDVLVRALHASSAGTLLLFAVLAAAVTRLGFLVAASVGVTHRWLQGAVAAAAGAAVLSIPSAMFAIRPSFQTLIYVGVTVAVALCHAVETPSARNLATITATIVVTAHGWALALPATAVAWLFVAIPLLVAGRWLFVALTAVGGAVASAWPLLATQRAVGVEGAAMGGYAEPLVWPVLVIGLAAAVVLAGRAWATRASWRWSVVALASALTVAEVLVLSARVGVPPLSYYLRKVLSIPTLLVVPLALALVAVALSWVVERAGSRIIPALLLATVALVGGWGAQTTMHFALGQREADDVRDLLRPLYALGADQANHAWRAAPGTYRDIYVRQLLDMYRPTDPVKPPPRDPLPVPQECAIMAHLPRPSVVTEYPAEAAQRYRACGFPVTIVDVRTVPADAVP